MKKILLFTLAACAILSAACSKNVDDNSQEATMTLKVNIPEALTKTYGDGKFEAKNLILGVYDENEKYMFHNVYQLSADQFEQEIQIQFRVGKTYELVFWAQYGETYGAPLDLMTSHKISAIYESSNNEKLDAFYAHVDQFTVRGNFSLPVTLTRPFAQINFATIEGDIDAATNTNNYLAINGVATFTISHVANTLDLLSEKTYWVDPVTGEIADSNTDPVSFESTAFAEGNFIEIKHNEEDENGVLYEVLSMNYVLVPNQGSDVQGATADLTLSLGDKANDVWEISVPSAPMKRNYRTNIIGQLMMAGGSFNVVVNPLFDVTNNINYNDYLDNESL